MAASAADRTALRRMVAEPTSATYDDNALDIYIEAHPLYDADGNAPDESGWTAVYDLNAAAADIWIEKAAALVGSTSHYQTSRSGPPHPGESELYDNAMQMHRRYAARRAIGSVGVVPSE